MFGLGLLTGLVSFCGTLYWVVGVMQTFGDLPIAVAALVGLLMASYLAIYPGIFAWLLGMSVRRFGVGGVWWAPCLWVTTEWFRSNMGGGLAFPWALLGASQSSVIPVVQAASVVGTYGLSALVALVATAAGAITLSRRPRHRWGAAAVAAFLSVVVASGLMRVAADAWTRMGQPMRVGLIQGSVDQEAKYDDRFRAGILERYLDLSRRAIQDGAQLVVWPEASTPFYFDADGLMAEPVRRLARESQTPFMIGTDEFVRRTATEPDRFYNSAVLVGTDGRSRASYRKMHLVPFGEYVPFASLLFFVGPLIQSVGDFSAGSEPVVFDLDGRRLSVAICYEQVYPAISRAFVVRGSELLVTITNDAWFKRSSAAFQHFDQSALRAVEEGRYVVRAANTGISGAVDPYGRVLNRTELFVPAAVTADVRLIQARTIYSRIGDVAAWVSLLATAGVLVAGRRRQT